MPSPTLAPLTATASSLLAALLAGSIACASAPCPPSQPAETPEERGPTPASVAAPPSSQPAPDLPGLMAFEPPDDTPPQVREQFGRLVGAWSCESEARQPDGTFKASPGRSRWTFFYTLGGRGIGDLFEPASSSGPGMGINIRVYDPEADRWTLAWTTVSLGRFDHYTARREGDTLVMLGEIAAKGPFPDHRARITFDELTDASFEWRYEATTPGSEGPWQVFSRIRCEAAPHGAPPSAAAAPPSSVLARREALHRGATATTTP